MSVRTCTFALVVAACDVGGAPAEELPPASDAPTPIAGWPREVGACVGEAAAPTRLLMTTTDFATGGVSTVALDGFTASADVAVGSTDAKPFYYDGVAYVLHRYGLDALDVLDPDDGFRLLAQRAIVAEDPAVVSANPHALVVGADGRGYVSLFGAPEVQVWDLADGTAPALTGRIDLSPLADADGNPEASDLLLCGDVLFVAVDRVDQNAGLVPNEPHARLAAVDLASGAVHDLEPAAPGAQGLALRGAWARQLRLDPADASGRTALVLTTGLERVDLSSGTSEWAVADTRLQAAGLTDYRQPQAFDLGPGEVDIYLAAYRVDFSELALFRAALDRDEPLVEIAAGLQSVEQSLEVVGDVLYFGDRAHGASGLRAWDLRQSPPTQLPGAPLALGLAPYAAVAIP
ncbi:hypothetical protein [Nannocystis punicea]|uniref:LVIVD repeat-containing protein n=1 Tax=Nannocystis punicea TaxID=2995304 RepID=A0ABY7HED9_9BACT|nr:hypothetical protein [Nannocystis poenicansa]WAS97561.1 hypothetical protein O0S08_15555 [Nannocystis poenicansa]